MKTIIHMTLAVAGIMLGQPALAGVFNEMEAGRCITLEPPVTGKGGTSGMSQFNNSCAFTVLVVSCSDSKKTRFNCANKSGFGLTYVKANSKTTEIGLSDGARWWACRAPFYPRVDKATFKANCTGSARELPGGVAAKKQLDQQMSVEKEDNTSESNKDKVLAVAKQALASGNNVRVAEDLEPVLEYIEDEEALALARAAIEQAKKGYRDESLELTSKLVAALGGQAPQSQATEEKTETINEADCESQGNEFIRIAIINSSDSFITS